MPCGLPMFMHDESEARSKHGRSIVEAWSPHRDHVFDTSLEISGYRPAVKENAFQNPAVTRLRITRLRMSRLKSSRWSNLCIRISTETAGWVPSSEYFQDKYCKFQACLLHAYHILVHNQFLGLHSAIARHDGIIIYKIVRCNN